MIVQLKKNASEEQVTAIADQMSALGYKTTRVATGNGSYLVGIGSKEFDIRKLGHMEGVADIHRVSDAYKNGFPSLLDAFFPLTPSPVPASPYN